MSTFNYESYRNPYVGSISDLMADDPHARAAEIAGQAQANAALQRGQAWAGAAQQIGQIPQQIMQQQAQQNELKLRAESARALAADRAAQAEARQRQQADLVALDKAYAQPGGRDAVLAATPGHLRATVEADYAKADAAAAAAKKARNDARSSDADYLGLLGVKVRAAGYNPAYALAAAHHALENYGDDPQVVQQINKLRMQIIESPESVQQITDDAIRGSDKYRDVLKPKAPISRDPTHDLIDPETLRVVMPGTPKSPAAEDLVQVDENGRPVFRPKSEAAGQPAYRAPVNPPAAEPLVPIMGPDNKPVLVPRSQAVGKTPATVREQGKTVTSGDAGRTAEFDSALDDLTTLRKTLGTTGAASRVGAALPNVVTELTGWGADAKARQGTIDRIKQVIGKTLEGGVLRKEDEIKYVKILPTIGDPPSVAKAKLVGLDTAIRLKRQRFLENLADAGYDTSQFKNDPTPIADVIVVRDKNGKLVPQRKAP